LQLFVICISDADSEQKELEIDENTSQRIYSEYVAAPANSIEADRATIAEKEKHSAETA